ncbi:MAG TPA: hypothetical protein VIF84_06570 [Candidatus Limnocylindrales bacterium]
MATAVLLATVVVAGCAPSGASPAASPDDGPSSAAAPLPPSAPAGGYPGWPTGPDPDATMVPIIVSQERVVGSNRFTYSLIDPANKPIASPELTTTLRLFDLAADPATPIAEVPGTFIWTVPDELGLYHASVDFGRAGPWGVEIVATEAGQPERTARAMFDVRETGTTPAIGAPAPPSETPTATDAAGIAAISTDPQPDPAFYETSVKDALAAQRPFVLAFATPAYCTSRTCGPTLDTVKAAVAPFGEAVETIHVEPYALKVSDGVPQPDLDPNGAFQVVPSAIEWGIPLEPYVFVVGADGNVAAKFEGAVGADELAAAIEGVVSSTP